MNVRLVVEKGAKRRRTFTVEKSEVVIGRRKGIGIRIPSSQVSRQHCRLYEENGVLMVEDMDSSNGTFLNEVAVLGPEMVQPGDLLQVGPVTFVVEYELSNQAMNRFDGGEMEVEEVFEAIEIDEDAEQLPKTAVMEELAEAEILEDNEPVPLEAVAEDSEDEWALPLEMDESDEDDAFWDEAEFEKSSSVPMEDHEQFRDFLSQLDDTDSDK